MMRVLFSLLLAVSASVAMAQDKASPKVTLKTNQGTIVIELYPDKAPITVENFLGYVNRGHYNGTIFHRVIGNFMIQGGGYASDLTARPTGEPIQNEADNGLSNDIGTIAMARTSPPHTATAQFFINVGNNAALNHRSKASGATWGYTVFGKVVEGMDVVNKIKAIPTSARSAQFQNLPNTPVLIEKASASE